MPLSTPPDLLSALGPRICIIGPSNSGKSTLAQAIARQRPLPAVHLDQLFHLPNTQWQPRPTADFLQLHAHAIDQPAWVMEGNYTRCMPERLARATGLIWLDISTLRSVLRYLRRTWIEPDRPGALEGTRDRVQWRMVHHLLWVAPQHRVRYAHVFAHSPLPKVGLRGPQALQDFYQQAQLLR